MTGRISLFGGSNCCSSPLLLSTYQRLPFRLIKRSFRSHKLNRDTLCRAALVGAGRRGQVREGIAVGFGSASICACSTGPCSEDHSCGKELYGEKLHSLPESSSTCNMEKAQGYFIVAFLIPLSAYLPIWHNDKMCQHFFSLLQSMKRDSQSRGEKTVKGPPTFLGRPL